MYLVCKGQYIMTVTKHICVLCGLISDTKLTFPFQLILRMLRLIYAIIGIYKKSLCEQSLQYLVSVVILELDALEGKHMTTSLLLQSTILNLICSSLLSKTISNNFYRKLELKFLRSLNKHFPIFIPITIYSISHSNLSLMFIR